MNYLTAEQVLFIHARLISKTGGTHGVRDLGLLQSALARPQVTFDGLDLYPNLFAKAAALLESLIGNHAFLDGNKRTAITSTGLFLRINDYQLTADNQQLEAFTLLCAKRLVSLEQMILWLETHSEEVLIAKTGKPVARLLPFSPEDISTRIPGIDKDKVIIMPDFDSPLPEFEL